MAHNVAFSMTSLSWEKCRFKKRREERREERRGREGWGREGYKLMPSKLTSENRVLRA